LEDTKKGDRLEDRTLEDQRRLTEWRLRKAGSIKKHITSVKEGDIFIMF